MMEVVRIAFVLLLAIAARGADSPPRRIISASPDITEILYGVGAFDRVVAVSDYCTYPPAVKTLPRIGKWEDSNLEEIVALRPDLVILTDSQVPFLADHLRELGVRYLTVPTRTLKDVFTSMDLIGKATGHEAQAQQLAERVHARLDALSARTRTLPRRRVLLVVDRTPGTLRDLYIATDGSFLCSLMAIAGGQCAGAPVEAGYVGIGKEAIVKLAPDAVIDFVHGSSNRLGEDPYTVWGDLRELAAVRDRRVYPVRDEFLPHPSQFVADTAELFARILHPEAVH
jgi:iron complex transport system substrate-binding protein